MDSTTPIQTPSSILLSDLGAIFWTSVVLLLAVFATSLASASARTRLALLFARRPQISSQPPTYCSDDDEDDASDASDEEDEGEEEVSEEEEDDECASPNRIGLSMGNRKISWPDLGWGDAVVKRWEGIGVRSSLNRFGEGLISLIDLNRGVELGSFLAGGDPVAAAAASYASPNVVLAAGASTVRAWDAREAGEGTSAAAAEWLRPPPLQRKMVGVAGAGDRTMYVGYDEGSVAVADLRSGWRPPLEGLGCSADGGQIADATVYGLCRFTF